MIWLPRTTDNSTYFAQSLEIRGIESRLYFVCFVALCSKSTALVMAGQSVHLTTLFPAQA